MLKFDICLDWPLKSRPKFAYLPNEQTARRGRRSVALSECQCAIDPSQFREGTGYCHSSYRLWQAAKCTQLSGMFRVLFLLVQQIDLKHFKN